MNKLKLAIIGCGRISANHIKAILDNYKNAELVALCDILIDKAEFKRNEYLIEIIKRSISVMIPNMYYDYKQMLQKEDIDVCSICTESGYHAEIALHCLNHNKHVIVEKPMAMSISDANLMIQTAKKNNLKLAVCHQNRFNLPIQKLKRGGRIGAGAIILPGKVIGEDALVAAGSVVTKDVPARKVVMGVPARVVKDVPGEQLIENQKFYERRNK